MRGKPIGGRGAAGCRQWAECEGNAEDLSRSVQNLGGECGMDAG